VIVRIEGALGFGTEKRSCSILVVDDDSLILEILRERLESEGFGVITHNQPIGTSAVILLKRPDVVLLDISLPGLSGAALSRLPVLRSTPIIYHSSKCQEELDRLVKENNVLGAIQKTSDTAKFMLELRTLLSRLFSKDTN
jgi:DNA-binding response OmpR family regulator